MSQIIRDHPITAQESNPSFCLTWKWTDKMFFELRSNILPHGKACPDKIHTLQVKMTRRSTTSRDGNKGRYFASVVNILAPRPQGLNSSLPGAWARRSPQISPYRPYLSPFTTM
ncbi:hypothetical protein E1B28_000485 [Marasmius oreades]|uniref:Uncharacterized protein n=1 Tax=Marasmius oreades TaxID=181124 RepID=A0A9P7V1I1_9AGAR|nr:uncharacterized protein E1B28_000485 [Marasmius oreades]KAG7098551.1 hypothetical protein E1B28_000485 [Marasmius oreades]